MVRASTRPDGVTAPIASGFSIHERMKRNSSSRRMPCFFSKLAKLPFDLALEGDLVRVEDAELAFDLLLDRALLHLEQTNLPADLLFKSL